MQDRREDLNDLIIQLCNSGQSKLDEAKIKEIKNICKLALNKCLLFFNSIKKIAAGWMILNLNLMWYIYPKNKTF